MPRTQTRIAGSNFTAFYYDHKPIAFLDEIHDTGQQPGTQYQAITPLGSTYPAEFAFPRYKTEGQLTCVVRELWNAPAWESLSGLTGFDNIVDIYNAMSRTPSPIQASTIISIPSANGQTTTTRGWQYLNVNVMAIPDSEDIAIGTLTVQKSITLIYANKKYYKTNSGITQ